MSKASRMTLDLVAAAHGSTSMSRLAADVIEVVTDYLPTTGVALTAYNPISHIHTTLCSTGFEIQVIDYLNSPRFLEDDFGYRTLIETPSMKAICWREITGDYSQSPSAVGVFKPSGIFGGASVRLTTPDGRYTGDLHIGTIDVTFPSAASMTALRKAASLVATATDISRKLEQLLTDPSHIGDEEAAAAINFHGQVFQLPCRRIPSVLMDDPRVSTRIAAWRTSAGSTHTVFRHYSYSQWWQLRLIPIAVGVIVEAKAAALPYGLTPREIEVLTLVSQGLHNAAIARQLGVSERTCAHHTENIMGKLGVSSRTSAASIAIQEGLRLLPSI